MQSREFDEKVRHPEAIWLQKLVSAMDQVKLFDLHGNPARVLFYQIFALIRIYKFS